MAIAFRRESGTLATAQAEEPVLKWGIDFGSTTVESSPLPPSRTPTPDAETGIGFYTGTVAVPRDPALQPSPETLAAATSSAQQLAAQQRADVYGVDPGALSDYYVEQGRFPDLTQLPAARAQQSATGGPGGPILAGLFGGDALTWWILASVGGLVLVLTLGRGGKKGRR